jgi:type II secretory pathway predicted ATPase ExeA
MKNLGRTKWLQRGLDERIEAFKGIIVPHPQMSSAIQLILEKAKYIKHLGGCDAVLVIADSGGGKSTLCRRIQQMWPDEELPHVTKRRVVTITIPKPCTSANLAKELLRGLGDPDCEFGTAANNRKRALTLFRECGTLVLLIDNFHDIPEGRRMEGVRLIGNWFRDFIDEANLVIVALGLKEAQNVMLFNNQIRRRAPARTHIDYFSLDTPAQRSAWIRLLHEIDEAMPLASSSNLKDGDLASRIFFATQGIFGYLSGLLGRALVVTVERGSETISRDDFKKAFALQHGDVAVSENPFDPSFPMRPLTNEGEPFYRPPAARKPAVEADAW